MAHTATFNPITHANKLKAAGLNAQIAETESESLFEAFSKSTCEENCSIKAELDNVKKDINGMKEIFNVKFDALKTEIKSDIKEIKSDLFYRMLGLISLAVAILGSINYFHR